ncbi:rare lipoprotein A [Caldithrix abyssi DSM 13497]|uniref:Rare lipoprotein A n=2 Tax=Caldithrix abyssi DSM 13497 TaxID=880073 RepID=A0A1J1C9R4_CALAY|nr:rare lipoprotein A [Caldithrix abyssi DSM 13497]
MFELTAAHRSLPFGTILEVENLQNGKKVRVRINDRGPFKAGRILDLSLEAARRLDFIEKGTTTVKATIIRLGKNK